MSERRLKILHYPTVYLDPSRGRPYDMIFIKEHILSIQPYHDNLVLSLTSSSPSGKLPIEITWTLEDGIDTVRIYIRRSAIQPLNRFLIYLSVTFALIRIYVGGFNADIVHLHIFSEVKFVLSIANLLRIPAVITEHWTDVARPGILTPTRLSKAKWVYEHSNMVIPVCDYLRLGIERNTGARFKFKIVNNSINARIFNLNYDYLISSQTTIRVLSVARIDQQKDYPTLIRAIKVLRDMDYGLHLHIIGDGNQRNDIETLIYSLSLNDIVTLHGSKPKEFIAQMMQQSTVFVLATKWENSPCVIGEALSCGLPVVATAIGGIPELISEEDGLLVGPGDVYALADAIRYTIDNRQLYDRKNISERAHARFSYEVIGKKLDDVYRTVVKRKSESY